MKNIVWIFILILLASCHGASDETCALVDKLNLQAYDIRYTDIDSTRALAEKAYLLAEDYPDGRARALNMLIYVDYQQMNFASAFVKLDSVKQHTSNQIILLVSDVLRMKINQRIGDGTSYFESRISAQKRMKRVEEEFDYLNSMDRHDYFFARTEFHIISSTYCYYQDQQQQAIEEMDAIANDFTVVTDSTQWLYYHYMMGSGGLIKGKPEEVVAKEFDHLMLSYNFARAKGVIYFQANSLQALASLLSSPQNRRIIQEKAPDLYFLLIGHHIEWLPKDLEDVDSHFSEALALHAIYLFRQYKDLFQTACAYRTMGEMAFNHEHYEQALDNYSMALDCVNEQFVFNNHHVNEMHDWTADDASAYMLAGSQQKLLSLYDEDNEGIADIELSWIDSDSIYTVPEWIAGIRQQISMAFSALGMTKESDFNRQIYLDIIARTSQNVEMESRKAELQQTADSLHLRLIVTALLFVMLVSLIIYYSHRLRKSNESRLRQGLQENRHDYSFPVDVSHTEALSDDLEELEEQTNLYALKIDTNKRKNAEKRAKVSLVHAVTPFLDRIINQIDRMGKAGSLQKDKLEYIIELSDRIVNYNELLTDWIKMEKGELGMQITTVQLRPLFETLQRGHYAYDQKGVTLDVQPTDYVVKADEALTLFMLNTLADNARKFTPEGGKVTVKADAYDDYIEMSITDTGCGMSAEDVDTLNNSKVYDSRKIGATKEGKGFGFGIMNCRGIINKYRKTSSFFQVCHFGVESQLGVGSRFFFRLPRVLPLLLFVFVSIFVQAQHWSGSVKQDSRTSVQQLYEKAYQLNQQADYDSSVVVAREGLQLLSPMLVLTKEEELSARELRNEVDMFLNGDSLDYALAINLRNEIARSSLALNQWECYRYNNSICTKLYKLLHQDKNLPTFCEKLERAQSTSRQLLVLLVMFSLLVIVLSLVLLRRRMYLGKGLHLQQQLCTQLEHVDEDVVANSVTDIQTITEHILHLIYDGINNWRHVEGMELSVLRTDGSELFLVHEGTREKVEQDICLDEHVGRIRLYGMSGYSDANLDQAVFHTLSRVLKSRIVATAEVVEAKEQQEELLNHLRYEEHRLYVQNQVLDNCLSTIKHESMYYPSRIQQLAEQLLKDKAQELPQLTELAYYYKEIYTLLSSQAERLTQQNYYRKETVSLEPILQKSILQFGKQAKKKGVNAQMSITSDCKQTISVDSVLMEDLMGQFNATFIKWYAALSPSSASPAVSVQIMGPFLQINYHLPQIMMDEDKSHTLFYPENREINLLVAKQIIRELDALNNFPGLRLVAEPKDDGTDIWFTVVGETNFNQNR